MGPDHCPDHTNLVQAVGRVEGCVKAGFNSMSRELFRIEKRINGAFKILGTHVAEGHDWRSRIIKIEEALKIRGVLLKEKRETRHRRLDIGLKILKLIFYVIISLATLYLMAQEVDHGKRPNKSASESVTRGHQERRAYTSDHRTGDEARSS